MISDVTRFASALDLDERVKARSINDSVVRFLAGPCTTTPLLLGHKLDLLVDIVPICTWKVEVLRVAGPMIPEVLTGDSLVGFDSSPYIVGFSH